MNVNFVAMGGPMLWAWAWTPLAQGEKKLLYDFFNLYLFFVRILGMILIDGHFCLKNLDPPLKLLPSLPMIVLIHINFTNDLISCQFHAIRKIPQ